MKKKITNIVSLFIPSSDGEGITFTFGSIDTPANLEVKIDILGKIQNLIGMVLEKIYK
jgi:hypothetical protein